MTGWLVGTGSKSRVEQPPACPAFLSTPVLGKRYIRVVDLSPQKNHRDAQVIKKML
jgi:hypothetical protein